MIAEEQTFAAIIQYKEFSINEAKRTILTSNVVEDELPHDLEMEEVYYSGETEYLESTQDVEQIQNMR